ncbi:MULTISPECIES: 1,2-phenylacetyl-CoA epoxidase subunit PaaC [Micrococcus]|uniref:Phenylacetate-CoA oxygenase subunit PaaI n=1 Tax=Micrococcus lylae TaxID=1273 RepID=A0ABY2K1V2_9MICC|nr:MULTISPECIES: 1,2-phenylacetyl-CoA epoxidase subunit PaaC [Micrococcus]PNL18743.1 phenylacetate-CoA oxygenase subunit PaaI [Micrococcus sp. FDAARGOS_333]TFH98787.1 phenylacetate-CoA oxygenase subunit PaaI [Micrococcus lylae]
MSFATNDSATKQSAGVAITAEEIAESGSTASEAVANYAVQLGDDALMLGQRLSWWISRAPELEEDIALGNIALDLVGHARFFLTYAGTAWGKTEDQLAYLRDEEEFRSARLVEAENGDFAKTIARQLYYSFYSYELYTRLVDSKDETLSAIANKALKEVLYHQDHAAVWLNRLGLGTEESARRMQAGLDELWPYVGELFYDDENTAELAGQGIAVLPSSLEEPTLERITRAITEAGLEVPTSPTARGLDRSGATSEWRGYILAEMQVLARRYPEAQW